MKLRWRTAHRSAPGYLKPTSSNTKPCRIGCGNGSGLSGEGFRFDLEEGEQVVEIEGLARRAGEARQKSFEKRAQAPERAGQKGEIADRERARQRAPDDVGIGQIVADGADRGEQAAPAGAPQREPAIGRV